jgi:hypothetical protein
VQLRQLPPNTEDVEYYSSRGALRLHSLMATTAVQRFFSAEAFAASRLAELPAVSAKGPAAWGFLILLCWCLAVCDWRLACVLLLCSALNRRYECSKGVKYVRCYTQQRLVQCASHTESAAKKRTVPLQYRGGGCFCFVVG